MPPCPDCGAHDLTPGDSCTARFDTLLALDHARREPWGSRHALAFAAFAVQHPGRYGPRTTAAARDLLVRVVERGEPLARVVRDFRAAAGDRSSPVPPPAPPPVLPFACTIADLGDFDGADYPAQLERWCRAALAGTSSAGDGA